METALKENVRKPVHWVSSWFKKNRYKVGIGIIITLVFVYYTVFSKTAKQIKSDINLNEVPMVQFETRKVGNSNLRVTQLSVGSWKTFETLLYSKSLEIFKAIRQSGINFLDDARYENEARTGDEDKQKIGYSEILFGKLFREVQMRREKFVLANKLWVDKNTLSEELDQSLQRMQMDYYDLVYVSKKPDSKSMLEFVTEIDQLVKSGKIRYWGFLNWPINEIENACSVSISNNLSYPIALQTVYNILRKDELNRIGKTLTKLNLSVIAAQSLASGFLTNSYLSPNADDEVKLGWLHSWMLSKELDRLKIVAKIAEKHNVAVSAVSINFVINSKPDLIVSSLFGVTSLRQLRQNLISMAVKLDQKEMSSLENL